MTIAFIQQQKGTLKSELHRKRGGKKRDKEGNKAKRAIFSLACVFWWKLGRGNSLVSEIALCCKSESGLVGVD